MLSTLVIVLLLLKLSSLVAVGNNDEISAGEYDINFIILQLCLHVFFLDEIFTQGQGLMLLSNDLYGTSKGIR